MLAWWLWFCKFVFVSWWIVQICFNAVACCAKLQSCVSAMATLQSCICKRWIMWSFVRVFSDREVAWWLFTTRCLNILQMDLARHFSLWNKLWCYTVLRRLIFMFMHLPIGHSSWQNAWNLLKHESIKLYMYFLIIKCWKLITGKSRYCTVFIKFNNNS